MRTKKLTTDRPITRAVAAARVVEMAEYKQKEFDEKAAELVWQLTTGGGSKNIHVLDTLRSLEWCYLTCAAYRLAANDERADG